MFIFGSILNVPCRESECVHTAVGVEYAGISTSGNPKEIFTSRLVKMIGLLLQNVHHRPRQIVQRAILDIRAENLPDILICGRVEPGDTAELLAQRISHHLQPFIYGDTTWEKLATAPTHTWLIPKPQDEAMSCGTLAMQVIPPATFEEHHGSIERWNKRLRSIADGSTTIDDITGRRAEMEFDLRQGMTVVFESSDEPGLDRCRSFIAPSTSQVS